MSLTLNSLGFVTVASPGTKVRGTTQFPFLCHFIRIQPRRDASTVNVGNVYIYGSSDATLPYAVLFPEQVDGVQLGGSQSIDLSKVWVDADNAGDGVLIGFNQ